MFIKELIFTKITRKTFVWNFVFIVIGNLIRHLSRQCFKILVEIVEVLFHSRQNLPES